MAHIIDSCIWDWWLFCTRCNSAARWSRSASAACRACPVWASTRGPVCASTRRCFTEFSSASSTWLRVSAKLWARLLISAASCIWQISSFRRSHCSWVSASSFSLDCRSACSAQTSAIFTVPSCSSSSYFCCNSCVALAALRASCSSAACRSTRSCSRCSSSFCCLSWFLAPSASLSSSSFISRTLWSALSSCDFAIPSSTAASYFSLHSRAAVSSAWHLLSVSCSRSTSAFCSRSCPSSRADGTSDLGLPPT
mmetsp:Transcript_34986/g.62523  ORF Transcript_34986/g.62523 Transcript_34986/m.62523 type:complete len:253 (-) Transcript_34986:355-1113(-)